MSQTLASFKCDPACQADRPRIFLHLEDLLRHYGREAAGRNAILAPGCPPLTYDALWARTNEIVHELRSRGIGRSDRVALVLPNGPDTAVAILAVAVAAVCVPLNPNFAVDEWQRYFIDLRVTALLTRADLSSACRKVAHALGIAVIDLLPRTGAGIGAFDFVGPRTRREVAGDRPLRADDNAFMLFTSGTEGRPKAVPLTHQAVCRSAYNAGEVLSLRPPDCLLHVLPLFHAHGLISALLTALAVGSSMVCTPRFDPGAFFEWLAEYRPTWYTAVPTIHRAILSEAARHRDSVQQSSLRIIRSASACLPGPVLSALESRFGVPVIETYGMTEAASQIAANPVTRRKLGSVGQSAGAEIAIMDGEGRQLRSGEVGEIVLRGPTLTKGYDNSVAATNAAFRDGWFRTGDLGYLDSDGYLFIVGRIKDVIKRGGQQVAPAEVEEALLGHPDVVEAAAFSVPHPRLGEEVAAVVVPRPNTKVSVQQLRNFAGDRLAKFKVPSLILFVPEIPKEPSGKIRRSGLATAFSVRLPNAQTKRGRNKLNPRSELEAQLAEIWADLLELDQVGVDQDVFTLGANSLTVTQMLSRLQTRFGLHFSFNDIFDAPTTAALAIRVKALQSDPAAKTLSLRDTPADPGNARLSYQQQRIQVLSKLDPTGYSYHVLEVVRLSGPLDAEVFAASIAKICERHEVLRSIFTAVSGESVQVVGALKPQLERIDLRSCHANERAAAIKLQAREIVRQPFDLEKGPPLQARLLCLGDEDHALVIKLHHLVTDGWSQRLFWEELAHFGTVLNRKLAGLPELALQYRQFAEWQWNWLQSQEAEQQRQYWRTQLSGLTDLPLRTDKQRPARPTGRGARHPLNFSRNLLLAIKSLGQRNSVTLFMTLLAAFQCLLYRYTQHDDVAVGSLIANRNRPEVEPVIGMFANTIVLRTDLSGDPSFTEVLRRVRDVTLGAYKIKTFHSRRF